MTPPLRLAALAATAALLLAGCASTVAGQGAFAGSTATSIDGGPIPSDSGTATATPTDSDTAGPTDSATPTDTGTGSGSGTPDSPCDVVDQALLDKAFGAGAKVEKSSDSCRVSSASGYDFMLLSVYQFLTLNGEKKDEPGGKDSTIGGRPAYTTSGKDEIVVSRTASPDGSGILVCLLALENDDAGALSAVDQILEKIVPHYLL